MPSFFNLRKWYLDCVTESGDTVIVYAAELSWRKLRLHYGSLLASLGGKVFTRTSTLSPHIPDIHDDTIKVDFPKLGIFGSWRQDASPVHHTMFESAEGSVVWNCLQPRSIARVHIADHAPLEGYGYAECLSLTIPPWKLPMTELRWGRFLSPEDSLVWIDWRGSHTQRVAFHNGSHITNAEITDDSVTLGPSSLSLDRSLVLRSGTLGNTIGPAAPVLRKIFPRSVFNIDEHKWRSRGTLTCPDHSSSGWAIHEVVRWNS